MRHFSWSASILCCFLVPGLCYGQNTAPATKADKEISVLIDKLQHIAEGDVGYMPTRSGSRFLPLGKSEVGALVLDVGAPPARSDAMRQLVARGAAAIPDLIVHLDDKRETKMKLEHESVFGGMFFDDEYDYNRAVTKVKPTDVNRGDKISSEKEHPQQHAVTVGDLCFVALGQIVNGEFSAVRYQPTACIKINSPTYSERLRKAIKSEWGTLTPAQHKESLIQDFQHPDFEDRQTGAAVRLGYYYPDQLEPLLLEQLATPLFNVFEVENLVRGRLYPAKDAAQRKALLDAFLAKAGEHARAGVLDYLFDDLDTQEADEQGRLSPRLVVRHRARECLIELFGYAKDVKSEHKPILVLTTETSQTRFIDAIAPFPSPKIDAAVRDILRATDDNDLARACALYLVGRGADADIQAYVEKRRPTADRERQRELARLKDQLGWTPLHVAADQYENEKMEELIAQGADVNARAANEKTPLHVAAQSGSYGGLRVLIKHKADLNLKDKDGKTPIQLALSYDTAVEILLDAGAELPDILIAAFAGRDDLVKAWLSEDKALAAVRSESGETPLHYAAGRGHLKAAEYLISSVADVNARDNDRNKLTPLHLAAIYGHHEVVALLLAHKADRTAKDWGGKTALDHARNAESIRILERP